MTAPLVDDPLACSNAAASRRLPDLDSEFVPAAPPAPAAELPALARRALELLAGDPAVERLGSTPEQLLAAADARAALADLLTVRPPGPLPEPVVPVLDALLGGEREARGAVDPGELPTVAEVFPGTAYLTADRTVLWRGDITTLAADAIVNAANSALLGCFVPGHACIDNAIHAAAGPRLRDDCDAIVRAQGRPEPVGAAQVTRGYHLPARFVLHTVGPAVQGSPAGAHAEALASSYRACLDAAASLAEIRTLAFCSISTGVFGYPKEAAAPVALATVAGWLEAHPDRFDRVVFDVYGAADEAVYAGRLASAHERGRGLPGRDAAASDRGGDGDPPG